MPLPLRDLMTHRAEFAAYFKLLRVITDTADHVVPALNRLREAVRGDMLPIAEAANDTEFAEFARAVLAMVDTPARMLDSLLPPLLRHLPDTPTPLASSAPPAPPEG